MKKLFLRTILITSIIFPVCSSSPNTLSASDQDENCLVVEKIPLSFSLGSITLNDAISALVESTRDSMPAELKMCIQKISDGQTALETHILEPLMPYILRIILPEIVGDDALDTLNLDTLITRAKRLEAEHCSINNDWNTPVTPGSCDLSAVLRLLCLIQKQIEICCEEIKIEIKECCEEIIDTITECCEEIIDTVTECCDEILNAIEECCEELEEDIEDCCDRVVDTVTECCAEIIEIIETLTGCCEEIIDTVTECCDEIRNAIEECCEELEEDIEDCCDRVVDTVTECCNEILNAIEECCEELEEDIEDCCDRVVDTITECCDEILTELENIRSCGVSLLPEDFPVTISTPGNYFVQETVTLTTGDAITITVDNVTLDLCNNTLIGNGGDSGIVIDGGDAGIQNITIKNGTVDAMESNGVVAINAINVHCFNINAYRCINGFNFINCQDAVIQDCIASLCTAHGFLLQGQVPPIVRCLPLYCQGCPATPEVTNRYNCVQNCKALSTRSTDGDVYGFRSIAGLNNTFIGCLAKDTHTDATLPAATAAGFSLTPINFGDPENPNICDDCGSKIVECEVCDTTAAPADTFFGSRVAGILLDSEFDFNTVAILDEKVDSRTTSISWSPSGCLLASGHFNAGSQIGHIRIWKVDKPSGILDQAVELELESGVNSVDWSANGCFLATGNMHIDARADLRIWKVNAAGQIQEIGGEDIGANVNTVAWSPDGSFLASGSNTLVGNELQVWKVDRASGQLTLADGVDIGANVNAVAWSPDQCYLAAGIDDVVSGLRVWRVEPVTGELTPIVLANLEGPGTSVAYSPDGCFLATGTRLAADGLLRIFRVERATGQIIGTWTEPMEATVNSVSWAPSGKYLASGSSVSAGDEIRIWQVDRDTTELTQLFGLSSSAVLSTDWSPDGCFLAVGDMTGFLRNFASGIIYPQNATIDKNQISRCFGGCGGFGIQGGSNVIVASVDEEIVGAGGCSNVIINNQVNNADFPYIGIPNVYTNGLCGQPCQFDNVAFPPHCTRTFCDANQVTSSACGTSIDYLPYTISSPGSYYLKETLTVASGDAITIASDNVTLDLCNNTIIGTGADSGIVIDGGDNSIQNITIKNGTVDGMTSNGVLAINALSVHCFDVNVSRSVNGFNFINCQDAIIENCIASFCTNHGFLLQGQIPPIVRCVPIKCQGCSANPEVTNKFNTIQNCKALSTRSQINDVYGFRSIAGLNNSFIKCIAKDTHSDGLQVNASKAAGFALSPINFGTLEEPNICTDCGSNIIECEVYDTTAVEADGFIVGSRPTGILLDSEISPIGPGPLDNFGEPNIDRTAVAWSPDGCTLIVGNIVQSLVSGITLLKVNKDTGELAFYGSELLDQAAGVLSVDWSSNGCYIAVGSAAGPEGLVVYAYNPITDDMSRILDFFSSKDVLSVAWSPDSSTLAVGRRYQLPNPAPELLVFKFFQNTNTLVELTSVDFPDGQSVNSVAYSPDGCYLAVGCSISDESNFGLRIYRVDQLTGLISVASATTTDQNVNAVAWSPDGCYLATGLDDGQGSEEDLIIWKVNKDTGALSFLSGKDTLRNIRSLDWSPDGSVLIAGRSPGVGGEFAGWEVVHGVLSDAPIFEIDSSPLVTSVAWSPDGGFIALTSGPLVKNFRSSLVYPQNAIVQKNQVSRSFGGCGGFGILAGRSLVNVGSSGYNLIINNLINNADYACSGVTNVYKGGLCGQPCSFDNITFPPECTDASCTNIVGLLYRILQEVSS